MNANTTATTARTEEIARMAADMSADRLLVQYALAFNKYKDNGDADSSLVVDVVADEIKRRMA